MCVSLKTGILGDGMINYQLSDKWYKVFSTFSVSYLNIFSMVILRLQWLFSPNFSSKTWPCSQNCSRRGSAGGPAALNLGLAGGCFPGLFPESSETLSAHCDAGAREQCPEQPGLLGQVVTCLPGRHKHLLPEKCEQSWNSAIWRPVS